VRYLIYNETTGLIRASGNARSAERALAQTLPGERIAEVLDAEGAMIDDAALKVQQTESGLIFAPVFPEAPGALPTFELREII
jgi:hypothetical protein